MSSLARHSDQRTRRPAAQSVRAAARARRADAGTLAEMARLLVRDAREAHAAGAAVAAGARAGAGAGALQAASALADRAAVRELGGESGRLSARPFAARRA